MEELRSEINAERDREDLRRVGQSSGIIAKDDGHKLEWMYRGPKENLNREDYLLGRQVDKTYEQFAEDERATEKQNHLGVSVPINHVEHECVPFSIRAYKDDHTNVQVDMARKVAEDPLMMIKQREMESRKKLLENPVKLKELKQLLQSEKSGKKDKKDKKKSKKDSKKSKKKKKKRSRSRSSGSSSNSDSDVDDALLAMLSKQRSQAEDDVNMEDLNFDEMVNLKYNTLSKELDKMIKGSDDDEGKDDDDGDRRDIKREKLKRRGGSDSEDDNRGRLRDGRRNDHHRRGDRNDNSRDRVNHRRDQELRVRRDRSPVSNRRDHNKSSTHNRRDDHSPRNHRDRQDVRQRSKDRYNDHKYKPKQSRRSPTPPQRNRSPDRRDRDRNQRNVDRSRSRERDMRNKSDDKQKYKDDHSNRNRHRSRTPETKTKRDKSSSREPTPNTPPPRPRAEVDSDDEQNYKKAAAQRNYGLVTASGQSIALKNDAKSYTDRQAAKAKETSSKSESSAKKPSSHHSKPKLTEKEKEERLREMMKNAEWRDKERETYVRKYHADGKDEEDRHREAEFDRNFIHKELHKSAQSETVESRLKSNRNNIQRSSGAMNTNFARR